MDDNNDPDQSFGDERMEGFLEVCGKIQENDPTFTRMDVTVIGCDGYGPILGRALRHNTHVEHLLLHVDDFYSEQEIAAGQFRSGAEDVLHFLQRSNSLQATEIWLYDSSPHHDELTEWMLGAIAENPSVRTVKVGGAMEFLENFLATAHFVQSLYIVSSLASTATMDAIGVACSSNRSLLKLTIRFDMGWNASSWCPILLRLHSHPTLVDLELISSYNAYVDQAQHITSLSLYLGAETTILRRLKLNGFKFVASTMELLMEGLSANTSVEELVFAMCTCDDEASVLLIDAMKQPTMSSIRHLIMHDYLRPQVLMTADLFFSPDAQPTWTLPPSLASMFLNVDASDHVGGPASHLQSLTLGGAKERLSPLLSRPPIVHDDSFLVGFFTTTLPSLSHLENLTIFGEYCRMLEGQVGLVYKSIQMNGSLTNFQIGRLNPETHVFFNGDFDPETYYEAEEALVPPFFSPLRQRRIDACLERNARVPQLLAVPNLENDNDNNEDDDDTVQQRGPTTEPSAFPPLFQASFQVPRTAHTNALIGLLALTTSVGDKVPE